MTGKTALFLVFLTAQTALFSETWNGSGMDWNTAANWTPATIPNAQDAAATFDDTGLPAQPTAQISASITLGTINFDQMMSTPYTITNTAAETIGFDVSSGNATVTVTSGTVTPNIISAPLVLQSDLTIDLSAIPFAFFPALTISADITEIGMRSLNMTGSPISTLTLTGTGNNYSGGTNISGGTLAGNASSLQGTITALASTNVVFDQTIPGTFNGTLVETMSGTPVVFVQGASTLTFGASGSNYSGFTTVDMGTTLQAGAANVFSSGSPVLLDGTLDLQTFSNSIGSLTDGSSPGSGAVTIGGGATLTIGGDDSSPPAFTGTMSGMGGLTKTGSGTQILSGTCSHMGATAVNQGILVVDGTLTPSTLTVNSGATLKGTGTLADVTVQSTGKLEPGNSIGTQTYSNLTFTSGSIFSVEIDPTTSSKAVVTNTAILGNATVQVIANPGSYPASNTYTILTAGMPLTDEFLPLNSIVSGLNFSLSYDANNVYLSYSSPLLSLSTFSGSDATIANYLNENASLLGTDFTNLTQLSTSEQEQGVNTINPVSLNNAGALTITMTTLVAQSISASGNGSGSDRSGAGCISFRHLDIPEDDRFLAMSKPGSTDEFSLPIKGRVIPKAPQKPSNIWLLAFGNFAHQDRQQETPAFNSGSGGGFIGYDWGNYSRGIIGGGVGYSYSHIHQHQDRGSANSNAGYAMVYGMLFSGNFFFDTSLLASYVNTASSRHIFYPGFNAYADSSQNSWILDPHIRFGYDWVLGSKKNWVLEPYGALDWINVFAGGFQEKHGGVYNMRISSHYGTLLQSEVGLNAYWTYKYIGGFLSLKGGMGYINKAPFALGKIQAALVGAASSITVESFTAVQNLASPSFELFWQNRQGTYASASYQGQFGSGYTNNAITGKLGKNF